MMRKSEKQGQYLLTEKEHIYTDENMFRFFLVYVFVDVEMQNSSSHNDEYT